MKEVYYVKNMVCDRCISSVLAIFKAEGFRVNAIELGKISAIKLAESSVEALGLQLKNKGFEMIKDEKETLIEQLKIEIINTIETGEIEQLSENLTLRFYKSYSVLSKLFSKMEGLTLEKYIIQLKIEKVKERIQLGQLNFSEIAYSLNYKTSSHLARQFKAITGVSMTEYKDNGNWNRKKIDRIV